MGNNSSSNKLFSNFYGSIQANLYDMHLSAEEKILYMYQDAYELIIGDLAKIYGNYAVNGKLSYAEMSKYNRLKNLEKQVGNRLLPQLKKKDAYLKQYLSMMYEESFYQHAYAIDQNGGCALKWGLLREEDLESIALSPLSKLSDSAFLKGDRDQAVFAIRKVISLGIIRGDGYPSMTKKIMESMGLAQLKSGKYISAEKGQLYKAMRIARTEGQRAVVEGQQKAYQKAADEGVEVEEVWDAAFDGRTRPEHGILDGKPKQEQGWFVPSIGWVAAPLQSGVASFDIHCRCRIRGQIKGYPPKVRGVKGGGQQPWTDYETWKKSVAEKGSAKSIEIPKVPKIETIPKGEKGANAFGKRLQASDSKVGGSTGAKVFVDDEGQEWIAKSYKGSKEKVFNEYVANQLYHKAGIQVAETRLVYIDDTLHIASKRLPDGFKMVGYGDIKKAAAASRVKAGFVADAWLSNWDVAGLDIDNLMWKDGKVSSITRIDQGGALKFRAQGSPKGSLFGKEVTELKTLRDPQINPASSKIFANVTDKDIAGQIRTIRVRLKKSDIYDILLESGLDNKAVREYYDILSSRFDYLHNWEKNFSKNVVTKPQANALMGHTPDEVTRMVSESWKLFTDAEKKAISDYTGSGYRRINKNALRGNYYPELDSSLDKLPYYDGIVGRGMSNIEDIDVMFEKWKSGEWAHVQWDAYSSTSITPGRSFNTTDGYLAVIKTDGTNRAGYINGKSNIASEDEYLFSPKSKFRVIGYAESPDKKKRTLLLEEMSEILMKQDPPKRMEYSEILQIWKDSRAR